jgi:hypothetical protein
MIRSMGCIRIFGVFDVEGMVLAVRCTDPGARVGFRDKRLCPVFLSPLFLFLFFSFECIVLFP